MIRKISSVVITTIFAFTVFGQSKSFKPFQFNFNAGYVAPFGKGIKGGAAFYIEPQYNITDQFSGGLRLGTALPFKVKLNSEGDANQKSVALLSSSVFTFNYYLQKKNNAAFRPFVGAGVGIAKAEGSKIYGTSDFEIKENKSATGAAMLIRAGFDVSHFRFNIEYNDLPATGSIKNDYFGINVGFYIGGGRKK